MIKNSLIKTIIIAISSLVTVACQQQVINPEATMIQGVLTFQSKLSAAATSQPARVHISLEDTSLADALPVKISEVIYHLPFLQPEMKFQLPYSPLSIKKTGNYSLSVSVSVQNQETYINTEAYPVLTQEAEPSIPVVLQNIRPHQ